MSKSRTKGKGRARKKGGRPTFHHGQLRADLLRLGLSALEELGIDGLTLRRVAERAGVFPTAVSHHFQDREGLLAALATEGLALLDAEGRATAAALSDPALRLGSYLRAYVAFAGRAPVLFELVFLSHSQFTREHPEREAAASQAFGYLVELTRSWRSSVRSQEPIDVLTRYFWSLAHGLASLHVEHGRRRSQRVSLPVDAIIAFALRPATRR